VTMGKIFNIVNEREMPGLFREVGFSPECFEEAPRPILMLAFGRHISGLEAIDH